MKVMVVGAGGREHALAWKLAKSARVSHVYIAPGNPGTAEIGTNVPIAVDNISDLAEFALSKQVDITVVGPEQPLALGIADLFRQKALLCFGPGMHAAQVETSKAFAKELMAKNGVPTAEFRVFSDAAEALLHIRSSSPPYVVKADGLAAGKGVVIAHSRDHAEEAVREAMIKRVFGEAGNNVVIEQFLEGREVSVMAVCNGRSYCVLPSSQDHKAAYDGDEGPNTGGMGAYSPVPWYRSEHEDIARDKVIEPVLWALYKQGMPYTGVLYCGLMLTDEGPKVLEINARAGDPETQAIMPVLDIDLLELVEAAVRGKPGEFTPSAASSAVCVVMASHGYPGKYDKGVPITGLDEARGHDCTEVFHAGTKLEAGRLVTSGGRVLGVTSWAEELSTARDRAYAALGKIGFSGAHFRKDIGKKGLMDA